VAFAQLKVSVGNIAVIKRDTGYRANDDFILYNKDYDYGRSAAWILPFNSSFIHKSAINHIK
jgi:hypothetical protein